MPSWSADGLVTGYDPARGPAPDVYHLASAGSVDVQGVTRLQYKFDPATHGYNSILVSAPVTMSPGDVSGNPGKKLTVSVFLAPASLFPGSTPTPSQILNAGLVGGIFNLHRYNAIRVFRASAYRTTTGTQTYKIQGPFAENLTPNTKYWVLAVPTAIADWSSSPSLSNDTPITSPDTTGRAISLWTNRTPSKPIITAPASGTVRSAGDAITFSFAPQDPDAVFGGTTPAYTDASGIEIQYAARPTSDNPNPSWSQLVVNQLSSIPGRSWFIAGSINNDDTSAMESALATGNLTMQGGDNDGTPSVMFLPTGTWQLRCRTFDYGHPFPTSERPFGSTDGNYDTTTTPASNTSPWSDPIIVTVLTAVPAPLALSPKGRNAYPVDYPITLSYQYRNAKNPPLAQAHRTIQFRVVGASTWTTLVDEDTASTTLLLSSYFTVAATTAYEWRVRAVDTAGTASDWMIPAQFWVVPAVGSGGVKPIPSSTIDGATLGCGTHRVFVYRRGGTVRAGEITGVTYVDYARVRDDMSTAQVIVQNWSVDCGKLLGSLESWAYEIVIFRDNGYSVERVWEGPITQPIWETTQVTINAKDVMAYPYRRILKQDMNDSGAGHGDTVVSRATRVLQNVMAPDDPNVLAYLNPLVRDDDTMEYRSTPGWTRTAFEEIDDMAANAGLDYTVVGRSILLWSGKHRIGTLPEFTDDHLGSSPIVSEYGMSAANLYSVGDGQGNHGDANRLNSDGADPVYGLIEVLGSDWTSGSTASTGTYTRDGLTAAISGWQSSAESAIADRYPPPVLVRIPDGTSLNPDTPISFQQLVPGVVIPVRCVKGLRPVQTTQKLDSVKVVEQGGVETITVTMSPFSSDDASIVANDNTGGTGG
jgi:hypothetical protein